MATSADQQTVYRRTTLDRKAEHLVTSFCRSNTAFFFGKHPGDPAVIDFSYEHPPTKGIFVIVPSYKEGVFCLLLATSIGERCSTKYVFISRSHSTAPSTYDYTGPYEPVNDRRPSEICAHVNTESRTFGKVTEWYELTEPFMMRKMDGAPVFNTNYDMCAAIDTISKLAPVAQNVAKSKLPDEEKAWQAYSACIDEPGSLIPATLSTDSRIVTV